MNWRELLVGLFMLTLAPVIVVGLIILIGLVVGGVFH